MHLRLFENEVVGPDESGGVRYVLAIDDEKSTVVMATRVYDFFVCAPVMSLRGFCLTAMLRN